MGKAAGIRALASLDASATEALTLPEKNRALRLLALLAAHSGDSPVWAVVFAAVWFLGNKDLRPLVILGVAGMVAVEMVVVLVKMSVRRQRPKGNLGGIYRRTDPYSFPSGHAARASMLAILSGLYWPFPVLAGVLIWAPVMLLSRIAIGVHYVMDILAGLALGAGLTFAIIEAARLAAGGF